MEEQIKIGVYICHCGTNIAQMVDVEAVTQKMSKLHDVVVAKDYKYMCSDPGQNIIKGDIKEHGLNRVVVAACSPRMHELTFRKVLEDVGVNPYFFEMANIREQCSWVHDNRDEATEKATAIVTGAIKRVNFHESLEVRFADINPATLIIGGGISGITSALEIANAGKKVYLIEKTNKLGGILNDVDLTFPYLYGVQQILQPRIAEVKNHPNIELFLESEIKKLSGYIGNFEAIIGSKAKETEIKFGNIIVAIGLKPFDAKKINNYSYGKLPNVFTSIEFEKMLKQGKILTKEGKEPKNVAIIHCVGSRNKEYHEYCSRTCCMTALKYANQISSALPNAEIYELYADMRAFVKGGEELYSLSSRKNITFLMFDQQEEIPKVRKAVSGDDCEMLIEVNDKLSGERVDVPADMIILMTAMEAQENASDVAHLVGISKDSNGFFIEKHAKLDPVATPNDGVYIIGACHGPKDIPDAISQARAATSRILATISVGKVKVESTTAFTNENLCCGCQTCIAVCPYTAISFNAEKKVSVVNEVVCKGCGTCASTCPTGAIQSKHFTDKQILSQIEGLMELAEV